MSKAKLYFRIRTKHGTKPQPIYLIYRFGKDDKLAYSTGFSIPPQYWNDKTGRPRDITANTTKDILFNSLDELQAATDKFIISEKAAGREISKYTLRAFLDSRKHPNNNKRKSDFLDYVGEFAASAPHRINPATGRPISRTTANEYKRLNIIIQDFAAEKRHNYTFADIDQHFYNDFISYLQNLKPSATGRRTVTDSETGNPSEPAAGLSTNTIGKYIQDIKTILNAATAAGVNNNYAYKSRQFKAINEDSENVYLTPAELQQLAALDLNNRPYLDRVRDLFLIGANTGLRFSDFTQLGKGNIKQTAPGKYNIEIKQSKTGKRVIIPANSVFLSIWNKYGGQLPPVISHKCFNEYIQKVCMLAGIDAPTIKYITKGGQKTTETNPKYKYIRAHTARRSFATNLFLSGFPSISIMQITGHKTETAFLRYIKVSAEQYAELLREHWNTITTKQ